MVLDDGMQRSLDEDRSVTWKSVLCYTTFNKERHTRVFFNAAGRFDRERLLVLDGKLTMTDHNSVNLYLHYYKRQT